MKLQVNPYRQSILAKKTKEHKFWSVLDLDGSFAAGSIKARAEVSRLLKKKGALIFSTARSPELVMSSDMLQISQELGGITRRVPKWHFEDGVYSYTLIEKLEEFKYCYNPDAILAFGEGIYLKRRRVGKQKPTHFVCDTEYDRIYLNLIPEAAEGPQKTWRELALSVVESAGLGKFLAPIEKKGNYEKGVANVEPLRYRIQLDFFGRNALQEKYMALHRIESDIQRTKLAQLIEGVDESKPDDDDPEQHRATLYLMPPGARKQNMLNRPLSQICTQEEISTHEMGMLILGDTLTDFYKMLYGAWDADVVGMVAGGSRLFKCIEEQTNFGLVDLQTLHRGLEPTGRPGFFLFDNPLMRGGWTKKGRKRLIILADRAYKGTVGAESLLAYLNDHSHVNEVDEKIRASA